MKKKDGKLNILDGNNICIKISVNCFMAVQEELKNINKLEELKKGVNKLGIFYFKIG